GAIRVHSKVGTGSVFEAYFPKYSPKSSRTAPGSRENIPKHKGRILIAEDNPQILRAMSRMISRLGYQTTPALDPREGLVIFKKDPASFDLVITDLLMPGLSGGELVRELLRIRNDLPVIVYSGSGNSLELLKEENLPIREYLQKPLSSNQLKEAIGRHLD
ncbi:MAG: response regulator, partial [Desulfomonilia bacterium]|nr:response regulator [Desulfomonilia bacterium]